jgi:hypothetical protein
LAKKKAKKAKTRTNSGENPFSGRKFRRFPVFRGHFRVFFRADSANLSEKQTDFSRIPRLFPFFFGDFQFFLGVFLENLGVF